MESILAPVLIIPGSPALVTALAPADAASKRLAGAVRETSARFSGLPVDVVCPLSDDEYTARTGTFTAWGAPHVQVGAGNYLGELLARYLLGEREYRPARETIGALDPDVLTVIVADGPAGLTPRAPLAFIDSAPEIHAALQRFIAGGTGLAEAETLKEAGVVKPEPWTMLAELSPANAELIDADDTLGVGRYVGVWEVAC